ncbi:MAG: hypothetical protein RIA09_16225 [Hoeflea sp.]|jgi:hypothetical protein|uniref:hypothetical protein n=1 Tax=Hoeflea sp. TaxID=1940281 RepID=UPI0032EF7954
MLPYRVSDRSLSVLIEGKFRTVPASAINFDTIVERLRAGDATEAEIRDLVDVKTYVSKITSGRVDITEEAVFFNGNQLTGYMANRVLAHLHQGHDIKPFAAFIDNLMDNPNAEVREDLFKWVEAGDMAFTEDGCFLAYKYVQDDYYSAYTGKNGKVYHGLGTFVTMPRSECDPSRNNTCSSGLHFCSYGYLGSYNQNHRIIIVKIHPSNVTAIPAEYHLQKGRCCAYTVVGELPQDRLGDVLRGRAVLRSFDEIRLSNSKMTYGDDALLNTPVEVSDFEENESRVEEDDPEVDDVVEPEAKPEPVAKKKSKKDKKAKKGKVSSFEHDGNRYTAKKLLKLVAEHGQRGVSRITGIPRTTLQSWLSIINR